jgi:hypothetical protein
LTPAAIETARSRSNVIRRGKFPVEIKEEYTTLRSYRRSELKPRFALFSSLRDTVAAALCIKTARFAALSFAPGRTTPMSVHSLSAVARANRPAMSALGLLAGLIASVSGLAAAKADDLIVKFDQSQILKLSRPAAEIIVGNPSIADVTVQSGNMLVVTGKSYGITNIIALDGDRNVIQDQRISVRRDEVGVVNVMKGSVRQTFACMPQCNPTATLGDDLTFLTSTIESAKKKMEFSEGNGNDKGPPNSN